MGGIAQMGGNGTRMTRMGRIRGNGTRIKRIGRIRTGANGIWPADDAGGGDWNN